MGAAEVQATLATPPPTDVVRVRALGSSHRVSAPAVRVTMSGDAIRTLMLEKKSYSSVATVTVWVIGSTSTVTLPNQSSGFMRSLATLSSTPGPAVTPLLVRMRDWPFQVRYTSMSIGAVSGAETAAVGARTATPPTVRAADMTR